MLTRPRQKPTGATYRNSYYSPWYTKGTLINPWSKMICIIITLFSQPRPQAQPPSFSMLHATFAACNIEGSGDGGSGDEATVKLH